MGNKEIVKKLRDNINQVFVGKEKIVDNLLICLLAGGHVLLEDVPGVGKTTLALTLAKSMDASFGRIQFTPDTLPSDVVGVSIYNMKTGEFTFQPGVVMNQILLGDEINRTSPKTQSSLLEAMAEGQITVEGRVIKLPEPFLVIATQNPIEFIGTYPLPEAQMDRFMMRLSIGYPEREQEIRMMELFLEGNTSDKVKAVCKAEDILAIREEVKQVTVKDNILGYIEDIVEQTRNEIRYALGASPRALLALVRASQARAYMEERDFVKPDDVKAVVKQVLSHRLMLTSEARIQKEDAGDVLEQIIIKTKIPV
ncbi:MAG: MoxR family ATPase [Lachnospiraceae bacterium]|nr:MoxR family ATPase [Lachnospiraceae bacterium]